MNKRFEEVEDLLEIEKYEGRHQEVSNMLSKIELDAHTKAIVEEAAKKTDEVIKQNQESNNQRIKGTRQHRSNEKLLNREQEAFKLSSQAQAPKISTNNVIPLK